eukprot:gene26322-biopygen15819
MNSCHEEGVRVRDRQLRFQLDS